MSTTAFEPAYVASSVQASWPIDQASIWPERFSRIVPSYYRPKRAGFSYYAMVERQKHTLFARERGGEVAADFAHPIKP